MLIHALFQFFAVVVDELAGQDRQAPEAGAVALEEHPGQLGRIARRRALVETAPAVVDDAGLGGVGDHDLQRFAAGHFKHLVPFLIGVEAAAHAGDDALVIHLLAVFPAPQVEGVQAFLGVDHLGEALGDGLHQHHFAVEAGFFVGDVDKIVNESSQKAALTEL